MKKVNLESDLLNQNPISVYSGKCGTNLNWKIEIEKGILEFFGSGTMSNYTSGKSPWYLNRTLINKIIFSNEMTSIGNYAFQHFNLNSILIHYFFCHTILH